MGFRDRKFGVELEFIAPKVDWKNIDNTRFYEVASGAIAWHLHYMLELNFRGSIKKGGWNLHPEELGSSRDPSGLELSTPIMKGIRDMRLLKLVAAELSEIGCTTDKTCGLHVHVDVSDLNAHQIAGVLARYQNMEKKIDSMIDNSRSDNDMCMSLDKLVPMMTYEAVSIGRTKNAKRRWSNFSPDRYFKINPCSVGEYGTLEFRHHHGTLNPERIEAWVKFCINFVEQTVKEMKGFRLNKKNIPIPQTPKPFWYNAQYWWYPQDVSYAFPSWSRSPLKGLQQRTRQTLQTL